ncbi:MAG: S-methyl-5-thioribose-1-phosphate isomerase [Phycisphaeraceae bacterium]
MNLGFETLRWVGDAAGGHLRLLDQTQLPTQVTYMDCDDVETVWDAIKRLAVRGAPAIGVAAGYGCVIAAQRGEFREGADYLATSRPTAVNLFWAIDRMKRSGGDSPESLLAEAKRIHAEDAAMCHRIGEHGLRLMPENGGVLTHCNAGALATAGIGTATAPMYLAHDRGRKLKVYCDETRPLLQGARLTAWELSRAGIDVTLICDDMAGWLMRQGKVKAVIVGADRITANGDAANKIGTYGVAVMAKHHGIPFYVAAPGSTFDLTLRSGEGIPIEHRDSKEVAEGFGKRTAAEVDIWNPAFDVTPADLIGAIITDRGVIEPVNEQNVRKMFEHD